MNDKPIKPRGIQGLTILAWGLQTDLLLFAIPMAIVLEARYAVDRRWALDKKDFYQIADLTSIGLVGLIIFLSLNARTYHFITTLLQWLPILLFPLTVLFAYSTRDRMPLDVLFYSLRRQREPVKQAWDLDYLIIGACLLATSTNTASDPWFFPLTCLIVLACLYPLMSHRYPAYTIIMSFALVIMLGVLLHNGMRATHLAVKAKTEELIANWIRHRTDPGKTRTALGRVGEFKLSDEILFRVKPTRGSIAPRLLHEASYDHPIPTGTLEWIASSPAFGLVEHAEDFAWAFSPAKRGSQQARIYKTFDRENEIVPVPIAITYLSDLPAKNVSANPYGAVQATGLVPSPYYDVRYGNTLNLYGPPQPDDLYVPAVYQTLMERITPADTPGGIDFVTSFFARFKYSLYQPESIESASPMERFLFDLEAGHCEYFASATTLLLRHLGIPARYVIGFSVQEYNESIDMYIVRQRHAHAWAIAYLDGEWHVVDTTPGTWAAMEEEASNPLRPLLDFFANYGFVFQLWWNDQKLEDYEIELYIFGGILVLVLIWRISTGEQVLLENGKGAGKALDFPGRDSPMYAIEEHLVTRGLHRDPGETLENWLIRIQRPELLTMVESHNRLRFDPRGLTTRELDQLARDVSDWIAANQETGSTA